MDEVIEFLQKKMDLSMQLFEEVGAYTYLGQEEIIAIKTLIEAYKILSKEVN